MYDVVILTENRYINPKSTDWYIDQVIIEDKLLLDELSNNNLKVCKKSWDDQISTGITLNIQYSERPGIILIGLMSFLIG